MSEMTIGILSMPDELFWSDEPLARVQHNAARKEAANEITRLRAERDKCKADADRLAEELAAEPLGFMSRAELQLNVMCNVERLIKRLPKNNIMRCWWDYSKNWARVQAILKGDIIKAGSTASAAQCQFIGADPEGDTFIASAALAAHERRDG